MDARDRFLRTFDEFVDKHHTYMFASACTNQWIGFHLDLLAGLVIFLAALLAVFDRPDGLTGGLAGLSLVFALQVHTLISNVLIYVNWQELGWTC